MTLINKITKSSNAKQRQNQAAVAIFRMENMAAEQSSFSPQLKPSRKADIVLPALPQNSVPTIQLDQQQRAEIYLGQPSRTQSRVSREATHAANGPAHSSIQNPIRLYDALASTYAY